VVAGFEIKNKVQVSLEWRQEICTMVNGETVRNMAMDDIPSPMKTTTMDNSSTEIDSEKENTSGPTAASIKASGNATK